MAYIADVENAILSTLEGVLFPNINYRFGDLQVSSVGPQVRLYRGWPESAQMDQDLALGVVGENPISAFACNVTVFPAASMARNTTRWMAEEWVEAPVITSTFTAVTTTRKVTFGGTYLASSVVGVAYGSGNHPPAFGYRLLPGDTPATVSAIFAAKFPTATYNPSLFTLTFPDDNFLFSAVVVDGSAQTVTRLQEQYFRITIWASTPYVRDVVGAAIDSGLSHVRSYSFPDGTFSGKPEYRSIFIDDVPEMSREWRADMQMVIEYPTTYTQVFNRALFLRETVTPNGGNISLNFGFTLLT